MTLLHAQNLASVGMLDVSPQQRMNSLPSPLSSNSTFYFFSFYCLKYHHGKNKVILTPNFFSLLSLFSPQTQKLTKSLCSYNVVLIWRRRLHCKKITERNSTPKTEMCSKREYFVNGTSEMIKVEALTGGHKGIPLLLIAPLHVH